jgi:hypothetical protein
MNFPVREDGGATKLPPKIKTIMNELKSRLTSLSSPFNRNQSHSENVKKAKEIILSLYEYCLSNEHLDEEGFFDIIEALFVDYLTEYELRLDFLIDVVELITPDKLEKDVKEELKAVAKEAFATYKVRKELKENTQLRKELIKALQEKSYAGEH